MIKIDFASILKSNSNYKDKISDYYIINNKDYNNKNIIIIFNRHCNNDYYYKINFENNILEFYNNDKIISQYGLEYIDFFNTSMIKYL